MSKEMSKEIENIYEVTALVKVMVTAKDDFEADMKVNYKLSEECLEVQILSVK